MAKITFIDFSGNEKTIEAENGTSLMQAAVDNIIPGIDGDCGGACACATCHVHVEASWLNRLPPKSDTERSMLDLAEGSDENSRLACQITVSDELDGLVLHTPEAQH
ncbi:2Fe-2S iron-sulfur cluster binding domain-containing protein [Sinimarinibacterium sp. CAU 1509]|uniref:2Fe-2S iron-sulfur cluster-binding protein n=1 Tax=Sinimarinibacterium sp. CAU 1509 TaxID=2562283 RepID=UPI0010AD634D|nr:2Fe-2S iron-sulfur cluster-binding protein [Sinimarinibacterium sp. CAU 1509]TJY58856.1 2Fe-2S iron-sulfur cluster binding domain-containing protein [Sinimarinibacterium sp. CAU 1509]